MYLNNFSARVPEGIESGGYVEIGNGKQYTLMLKNDRNVACDAEVTIDGKPIGTFRIYANSGIRLERAPNDTGKFTFYELGTDGARMSLLDLVPRDGLGLIKVIFTPEIYRQPVYTYYQPYVDPWNNSTSTTSTVASSDQFTLTSNSCYCSVEGWSGPSGPSGPSGQRGIGSSMGGAGGTGISGHSNQGFCGAEDIELDYSQQTTIYLRLISTRSNDPRPLRPASNSTAIPPRIG
jgi:hypothetical protein